MAERISMARHPMKLGEEERKVEEEDERARKDSRFWITVVISVLLQALILLGTLSLMT
jgi:hypothetical protein